MRTDPHKEAKEFLSRAFLLRQEKAQLERARRETYMRLTSATQRYEPRASGTPDPHRMDTALIDLDSQICEMIQRLDRVMAEIFGAIQQLPDRKQRMCLMGRYYEGLTWGEIAAIMHYELRNVHRIHGQALTAIEPVIKGIKKDGL